MNTMKKGGNNKELKNVVDHKPTKKKKFVIMTVTRGRLLTDYLMFLRVDQTLP